jgi:hypothetical protein
MLARFDVVMVVTSWRVCHLMVVVVFVIPRLAVVPRV